MSERHQGHPSMKAAKQRSTHMASKDKYRPSEHTGQIEILDFLPIGAENAISGPKLVEMIGLADRRELQRLISDKRKHGAIICANSHGYFIPGLGETGRDEIASFVAFVDMKAAATFRSADSARRFLRELIPGQETVTPARTGGDNNGEE